MKKKERKSYHNKKEKKILKLYYVSYKTLHEICFISREYFMDFFKKQSQISILFFFLLILIHQLFREIYVDQDHLRYSWPSLLYTPIPIARIEHHANDCAQYGIYRGFTHRRQYKLALYYILLDLLVFYVNLIQNRLLSTFTHEQKSLRKLSNLTEALVF